jgi:parallel beta-helix repeat protein
MRKLVVGMVVACLILSALHYQPVRAADLYVDDTGINAGNCQNSSSPCRTIQYAINQAAASGDTIHVAAGTYRFTTNGEIFPITINKNLTLEGAGEAITRIEGNTPPSNPRDVIQVGSTTSSVVNISGFTITGGRYVGVRYLNGSSGVVTLNQIVSNGREGVRIENSSPTIIGNDIYFNAYDGVHVLNGSNARITNNFIANNERHGIYVEDSNPVINGNLIVFNGGEGDGEDGGGDGINIDGSSSSPIITNNTIAYNYDDNIDNEYGGNPTIANNIIAFSIDDEGIQWNDTPGPYPIFNNDVYSNDCDDWMDMDDLTGVNGNISADPLFVEVGEDYSVLACDSPVINAGSNGAPEIPDTDIYEEVRIVCIVDIGAIEVQADANCPCPQQRLKRPTNLPSLLPAAQNHISQGNDLLKQVDDLLSQAKEKGADCTECEKLINEAKELLDKSKASLTNPIYANNLALQALEKLKDAIDCLKALLG